MLEHAHVSPRKRECVLVCWAGTHGQPRTLIERAFRFARLFVIWGFFFRRPGKHSNNNAKRRAQHTVGKEKLQGKKGISLHQHDVDYLHVQVTRLRNGSRLQIDEHL